MLLGHSTSVWISVVQHGHFQSSLSLATKHAHSFRRFLSCISKRFIYLFIFCFNIQIGKTELSSDILKVFEKFHPSRFLNREPMRSRIFKTAKHVICTVQIWTVKGFVKGRRLLCSFFLFAGYLVSGVYATPIQKWNMIEAQWIRWSIAALQWKRDCALRCCDDSFLADGK